MSGQIPSARAACQGFTLIEVLASLLIIAIGMMGVVGMVWYGITQADRSRAANTAMATALSVLDDPTPLHGLDWNHTPAALSGGTSETTGRLNGYFVRRRETSSGLAADGLASTAIQVDVYLAFGGTPITSLSTRRMKRD